MGRLLHSKRKGIHVKKTLIRRWTIAVASLGAFWVASGAPIFTYF